MKRLAVFIIAASASVLFTACDRANDSDPVYETQTDTEQTTYETNTENDTESTEVMTENDRELETTHKGTDEAESETFFEELRTDAEEFFEEGTVSNGYGEGVIDQIGDDIGM